MSQLAMWPSHHGSQRGPVISVRPAHSEGHAHRPLDQKHLYAHEVVWPEHHGMHWAVAPASR